MTVSSLTIPHEHLVAPPVAGPGWSPWRTFAAAWAASSTYRIAHLVILKVIQPLDPPSASVRIGMGIFDGALVGLCTLALVTAGARFPVEKPHRARNVIIHVALAFACSIVTLSTLWTVGRIVSPDSPV